MARVRLGREGERLARQYLEGAGYRVVAANYRCLWGEIDLIAWDGAELVFVEVRSRRSSGYGSPEESITPEKMERLLATAQDYLQNRLPELGRGEIDWRIDLIGIRFYAGVTEAGMDAGNGRDERIKEGRAPRIEHLKYAVEL